MAADEVATADDAAAPKVTVLAEVADVEVPNPVPNDGSVDVLLAGVEEDDVTPTPSPVPNENPAVDAGAATDEPPPSPVPNDSEGAVLAAVADPAPDSPEPNDRPAEAVGADEAAAVVSPVPKASVGIAVVVVATEGCWPNGIALDEGGTSDGAAFADVEAAAPNDVPVSGAARRDDNVEPDDEAVVVAGVEVGAPE